MKNKNNYFLRYVMRAIDGYQISSISPWQQDR